MNSKLNSILLLITISVIIIGCTANNKVTNNNQSDKMNSIIEKDSIYKGIEVVSYSVNLLSHELETPAAIADSANFHDSGWDKFRDRFSADSTNLVFKLGKRNLTRTAIDIRTEITIIDSDGKQHIYYLDCFGNIFYERMVYFGDLTQLEKIRSNLTKDN